MSIEIMTWAFKQPVKPSSLKFVLVVLANCANTESGLAYPSIAYLSSATGQDRKTVLSNMSKLRELGVVEDTGKRVGSTRQVVVYKVLCTPILFNAVLDSTENGTLAKKEPETVPKSTDNSTVFPNKEAQKRDTEPSLTISNELSSKRGSRLPADWLPSCALRDWLDEMGFDSFWVKEFEVFKDYWKAVPGKAGVKLDWDATFRNWMRKAAKGFSNGKNPTGSSAGRSAIDRVTENIRRHQQNDARENNVIAGQVVGRSG
jgi:hypothetical protein